MDPAQIFEAEFHCFTISPETIVSAADHNAKRPSLRTNWGIIWMSSFDRETFQPILCLYSVPFRSA